MGKQNHGSYCASQAAESTLQTFIDGSRVIAQHSMLLRWCCHHAANRQRNQIFLRDLPDDVFSALQASELGMVEALTILCAWSQPPQSIDVDGLASVLDGAIGAVNLEALRRAGELEIRDAAPLFGTDADIFVRPVPGSQLEHLVVAGG